MEIKEKIVQTLIYVADELREVESDLYIIGGAAMVLSDIEIGETSDIDILTTNDCSNKLKQLLQRYMEISPETKEDELFRSDFARFSLPLMDIEVMGELQIKKEGIWQTVCINDYKEISVGSLLMKIPTLSEQKRILSLFGRPKDLARIDLLDQSLFE